MKKKSTDQQQAKSGANDPPNSKDEASKSRKEAEKRNEVEREKIRRERERERRRREERERDRRNRERERYATEQNRRRKEKEEALKKERDRRVRDVKEKLEKDLREKERQQREKERKKIEQQEKERKNSGRKELPSATNTPVQSPPKPKVVEAVVKTANLQAIQEYSDSAAPAKEKNVEKTDDVKADGSDDDDSMRCDVCNVSFTKPNVSFIFCFSVGILHSSSVN